MDANEKLLDPRFPLVLWNEQSQKWQDHSNDHWCSPSTVGWRVSARYGFPDGRRDIEFTHMIEAFGFFVNYIYSKRMRKTVERD